MFALVSCNQDSSEEVETHDSSEQSVSDTRDELKKAQFLEVIEEFEVKDKTLPEAINTLNKLIIKKHPGRKDLLIAYVESLNSGRGGFGGFGGVSKLEKIDIHLINNPPIVAVVRQLTTSTATHFRIIGPQIVIYGWSYPQYEDE